MKRDTKKILNVKLTAAAAVTILLAAMPSTTRAQVNTNPVPNLAISWSLDSYGFDNAVGGSGVPVPNTAAGLALATNWNDTWSENFTHVSGVPPVTVNNLFDITGAATSVSLTYAAWGSWYIVNAHVGPDADGSYNREMLNGFLNAGPAAWGPNITNSSLIFSGIPYTNYDVVVYISDDTSGRKFRMTDGAINYYGSTVAAAEISGANALFLPTTQTSNTRFPSADFAFFPGETNSAPSFNCYPLSGNDQWLGISSIQIIQASNVYVLFGPSPVTQIVPVGQPASFSVMAGGLTPQYQWQHAGTNIPNATSATYSIVAAALGQDGSYDVIVSNSFSAVTSAVATLTFYTPKTDTWDGVGSAWDTSSTNWTVNNGVSKTNYTETDNVVFGPLGAAQPAVSLASTFTPSSITVSNAAYTLASGGLAGTGSLHVMNNATLILDTGDTSTGPTLIDSGSTLQLDNNDAAGALGSGPLTNNGALVFNSSGSYAYGFPIYGTGNITNLGSANEITLGAGVSADYLVQAGAGQLLLQGNNNLTGGLVVSAGTVYARVNTSLGQGTVVLNGGMLQLYFANDFTGSAMTLAGGALQGGLNGNNSYDGTVSLAVDSDIDVGAGDTFTLNSAAGLNGAGYNFSINASGGGTLILPGTDNTWASVTINAGTLQIGNGGSGSLGAGTITDSGALTFDVAGNLVVTNPITGGGAINQNGAGTVTLTADNNSAGFGGPINVNSGTLLINGTGGTGGVSVNGGALGGTGAIESTVVTSAGSTLFAGAPASVGTLAIVGGDLDIGGNVLVKLHKSLAQSNDVVTVSGALNNTGTGIVNVENLGPALAPGDKFTIFSKAVGGNALTVAGNGVVWNNNLAADGSISVQSLGTVSHPTIQSVSYGVTNVVFSGATGYAYGLYHVLSSTNLALGNWTLQAVGNFDASGNFSVTNSISGAAPETFYKLQLP
ncbi:MAG: autotransporter-associated beta strand repeat-containing protein [Verrucomicrobiota bacterium]